MRDVQLARMGKRFSEQKRALVLRKLEDSELTGAEFCRRRGLCYATVMRWRREAQMNAPDSNRLPFVEVELTGDGRNLRGGKLPLEEKSVLCAELSLPGGAVLRLYGSEQSGAEA